MPNRVVHLPEERARVDALWRGSEDSQVPLDLAAAFAFNALHDETDETVSMLGYRNDLDLVAAALSRHFTIFARLTAEEGPTPLPINLRLQRFANGASELHGIEDGFFFDRLSILRADVQPAIALMKRAGISLTCQNFPVSRNRHLHASD